MPRETVTSETSTPATTWFVVSQVKSNRVVYFTDDPDYSPPMQGDWHYVSPHLGELPAGMTLRNCWRWRFDGHAFVDAGGAAEKPPSREATLLQANKDALLKLLDAKIDACRLPFAPLNLMGEQVRSAKLAQARALLRNDIADVPEDGYLIHAAAAQACTLREMAQRIVDAHQVQQELLCHTEQARMHIAAAIARATTQAELIALRRQLMEEIAPEINTRFAAKPEHTTLRQMTAKPDADTLVQEQLRLSVQLRERINALRRPYLSHYLLDEVVLRHKGQIAQAALAHGGALPNGLDGAVLISHAAARGQTLLAAAKDVLGEMNETARVLLDTEQLKDAWSVRIASIRSYADIDALGKTITRLQLPPPVAAAQFQEVLGSHS